MNTDFEIINRLPPYVFNIVAGIKSKAIAEGNDIVDLSMGNPDNPPPDHITKILVEAINSNDKHRYSQSIGILPLREAICKWYDNRYQVKLDPSTEAITTIGSKEGIAHLAMATMSKDDLAIIPSPSYPIHQYAFVFAGASIHNVEIKDGVDFPAEVARFIEKSDKKPKMLVTNFPNNPTTITADKNLFKEVVSIAKKHGIWILQDLAYADIAFDGLEVPSILQVDGAKDVAVEFFSLSKSYNMPGWRIGFCCGNKYLVNALTRIKSYIDYGNFEPIQIAAAAALQDKGDITSSIRKVYQERRDIICSGLNDIGWQVTPPSATMFVWAKIPDFYRKNKGMNSLDFSKHLLNKANLAVSPGSGFGKMGDEHIRIALIENEKRSKQAINGIKSMFKEDNYNPIR